MNDELKVRQPDNYDEDNPYRVIQSDGGKLKDFSSAFEKKNTLRDKIIQADHRLIMVL